MKTDKEVRAILSSITRGIKKYNDFLHISADKIAITCDTHAHLLHENFVFKFLDICRAWKIKVCVHAGDLFNLDCFSSWGKKPGMLDFAEEVARTGKLLALLCDWFDKIYLIRGNHDSRIMTLLNGDFSNTLLTKLLTDKNKVITSEYTSCDINSNFKAVHPGSYSKISGNIAKGLCSKYLRHIITAHGHFTSKGYDVSGKFHAIDMGGNIDREKTAYIHERITNHPKWIKSFVIIADDHPFLIDENEDVEFWKFAGKYYCKKR